MLQIVLFLQNANPDAGFHYGSRFGRTYTFLYNRETTRHEITFTLDEWRADNYAIARELIDQAQPVPIFFDVTGDVAPTSILPEPVVVHDGEETNQTEASSAPTGEPVPEASLGGESPAPSPKRRGRKAASIEETRAETAASAPLPAFIPA